MSPAKTIFTPRMFLASRISMLKTLHSPRTILPQIKAVYSSPKFYGSMNSSTMSNKEAENSLGNDSISTQIDQLVLTPAAIKRLEQLSAIEGKTQYLRVLVESGGCYGFQYKMDLTSTPQKDDIILSKGNAKMVIDKLSLGLIRGATVDWVDEIIGYSFKIVANPNSSGGCGCGASFEIKM